MIVFKRLHSLACFRTRAHLLYAFSSTPHKLSNEGQQAVWAYQIINLIKNPTKLPKKLHEKSLLDHIKELHFPTDCKFEFKKQGERYLNKEEVMKLMTDGIILNPFVYRQDRIKQAEQSLPNLDKQENPEKQTDKQPKVKVDHQTNNPFIFYPSYLGTSQMFTVLEKKKESHFVITGKTGIGKTISIIFYIHLSNFITKYVYQCSKDSKLQQQLQLLQKENMLSQQIYKYWYWSVSSKDVQEEDPLSIEKLILEQAVELNQQDKNLLISCKNLEDFQTRLRKIYPKAIQRRAIVDQVDAIASYMRRWNYYYESTGKKVEGNLQNATRRQKAKLYQYKRFIYDKAVYLRFLLKIFTSLGKIYGLNSSLSIQKELIYNNLADLEAKAKLSQLAFNFQNSFQYIRIPYEEIMKENNGKIDFWNIGWFQIWRRFKQINTTNITIDEIKSQYFKAIENKQVSNYFRFVRLRIYLDTYQYFFKDKTLKAAAVRSTFNKMFNQYPKYCLSIERNMLGNALSKCTPWQQTLLYILQDFSQEIALNEAQNKNNQATFDLSLFNGHSFLNNVNFTQNLMKLYYHAQSTQIMPYCIEDKKMLTFYWTYKELNDFTTHALFPQIYQRYFANNPQLSSEHFKQNGGQRGAALQYAIKNVLTPNSILNYQVPVEINQQKQIKKQ